MTAMGDSWDALLDELADRVAARVFERLQNGKPGMLAQSGSPLGSRRHCAAVQRRVLQKIPGAAIVGRQHFLTPEAMAEELESVSSVRAYKPPRDEDAGEATSTAGHASMSVTFYSTAGESVEMGNATARIVLGLLGRDGRPDSSLEGHMVLPMARARLAQLTKERLSEVAVPMRRIDAMTYDHGTPLDWLEDRVNALCKLVTAAEQAGALHLRWG